VEWKSIVVVGRSLGSGPTVDLAQDKRFPVRAMVLVSPIASCIRVVYDTKCVTLKGIDMFPNVDKMKRVRCPVLVVHGAADELVEMRNGEALWKKAGKWAVEPLWIQGGDHNSIESDVRPDWKEQVLARLARFFDEVDAWQVEEDQTRCWGTKIA